MSAHRKAVAGRRRHHQRSRLGRPEPSPASFPPATDSAKPQIRSHNRALPQQQRHRMSPYHNNTTRENVTVQNRPERHTLPTVCTTKCHQQQFHNRRYRSAIPRLPTTCQQNRVGKRIGEWGQGGVGEGRPPNQARRNKRQPVRRAAASNRNVPATTTRRHRRRSGMFRPQPPVHRMLNNRMVEPPQITRSPPPPCLLFVASTLEARELATPGRAAQHAFANYAIAVARRAPPEAGAWRAPQIALYTPIAHRHIKGRAPAISFAAAGVVCMVMNDKDKVRHARFRH